MDNNTGVMTDPGGFLLNRSLGLGGCGTSTADMNITACLLNYTLNVSESQENTSYVNSTSQAHAAHPLWLTIFLGLLAGTISIVTIFGNIIVLLSFGIERSIRQPTNYFLASLAVSDLLIGTFSMPLFTQYLLLDLYWPLGPWLCDLWLSLDWTVCLTSQYTVFLITMDRFLSVKVPAKYRNWRTERKVLVMIAVTWILPTVVFFTAVIGWQYFVPEGRTVKPTACEVQFMNDPLFTFLLTIGYYWITLVVMCVLYAGIYRVALTLQKKSDAKHKKLQSTMELAIDHTAVKATASNSSDSIPQATKKAKKQSVANNKTAATGTVTTTSFVKRNNSEKDEDRSSSPAFASDEENSSSQGTAQTSKTPLTANSKPPKIPDKGFINNALQPDSSKTNRKSLPTDSAFPAHIPDTNFLVPTARMDIRCDFISEFESGTQVTDIDNLLSASATEMDRSSVPLIQNDVLKGIRFIDEKSFSNLAGDNVKLLSESQVSENVNEDGEGNSSPIWRRRNSLNGAETCPVESIHVRVPLATEDTFGEKPEEPVEQTASDGNNLHPYDNKDSADDRGMQRLTAGGRRRRKDGRLQTFVKSVRSRNSRRRNRRERKSKSENRARKALRTITLILGAFVVCWTPYHIMVFVIAIAGWESVDNRFYSFTYWLCYLNSPINPFCYAFANAQFKRTFLRIFKLDWHRT
ncbi:muscarinic acetylcholine receptor gar-2-like [Haliotis cracherodii]|uniref:muscarinic acetylcholine receptor gar-2-like n=1 Tax=Haliotis cracherodii TaxID=6455 RepID=UPI0039E9D624